MCWLCQFKVRGHLCFFLGKEFMKAVCILKLYCVVEVSCISLLTRFSCWFRVGIFSGFDYTYTLTRKRLAGYVAMSIFTVSTTFETRSFICFLTLSQGIKFLCTEGTTSKLLSNPRVLCLSTFLLRWPLLFDSSFIVRFL